MIAASPFPRQPDAPDDTPPDADAASAAGASATSWQAEFAAAVTDPAELAALLDLPPEWVAPARAAAGLFPLRVPRSFIARMRRGDPADPLLRQVLPVGEELADAPGRSSDPLEEAAARRAAGLLHKYHGRALLVATGACAMHCRYCFRRGFPYDKQQGEAGRWQDALTALAADPSIEELILSGGDPLSLGNARLQWLSQALAGIPHLRALRLHTRNAVVLPSRVDAGLIDWLRGLPWRVTVVLHVNHPQELEGDAVEAIARLRSTGVLLLNQSVLLRGVNDDAATLAALSKRLHAHGVLPYYLHLTDAVTGTAHFDVDDARGRQLVDALARGLPGYLVPRLVREVPGASAKVVLASGIDKD
jgi:EF-P beta-lysylation protein EpmB